MLKVVLVTVALVVAYQGLAVSRQEETWTQRGFEEFSKGTFGGAGQNTYVSARGRVQLINRLDLNQDGYIDIAIGNGHPKTEKEDVFIYTNRDGDFSTLDRIALPADGAHRVAIADLDRDGYNDLILAQRDNGITPRLNAFVYLGGASGFTPKRRLELPAFAARDLAAADLNGDGWIDIALACENEGGQGPPVSTVYWNSNGTFDSSRRQDFAGPQWQSLTTGDWDNDGRTDLIVSTPSSTVLYRGALRELSEPQTLADGAGVVSAADWNGDRRTDLAVVDRKSLKLYANVDAGLKPSVTLDVPNPSAVAWSDFDRDGRIDLLVAVRNVAGNEFTDSLIIWNDPQGFDRRERVRLPTVDATDVRAADLDADGYPEAVFANHRAYNENNIQSFVYWNSRGTFDRGRKTMLDTRGATGLAIGDINHDDRPDIVFANSTGGVHEGYSPNFIYWGDGTRNYSVGRRTVLPSYYTTGSVQADLDDDGWVDIGFNEGRYAAGRPGTLHGLHLWWGSRSGFVLDRRSILSVFDPSGGAKAADLNRDGRLDLIVGANESDGGPKGGFVIFWGAESGYSVRRRQIFPLGSGSREPLVADLNGDGHLDLAASPTDIDGLYIYWGAAKGFDPSNHVVLANDRQFGHAEAADLNADGYLDLIAPTRKHGDQTEADSFVYYGSANGLTDTTRVGLPTMAGYDPSVADLNRDGWLDIVFPNYSATRGGKRTLPVYIYWGSPKGFDRTRRQELPADAGSGSMIADFDGDGWRDLFIACHRQDGSRDEAGKPHTHHTNSLVYWNGPDGFQPNRRTELPAVGPHAQTAVDVGNVDTREMAEYYTSPAWSPSNGGARVGRVSWEAETPHGTSVALQIRGASTKEGLQSAQWVGPSGPASWFEKSDARVSMAIGPWVQYRARLSTPNGGPTPYLLSVTLTASGPPGNESR